MRDLTKKPASARRGWRNLIALVAVCAAVAPAFGQALDSITYQGGEVHPTRILARFKAGAQRNLAPDQLEKLGSQVTRRYKTLPDLVLIDEAAPAANANQEARLTRLTRRLEALQKSGLFQYVEPDRIVYPSLLPTDQAFTNGTLWGLRNYGQNGGIAGADISATNAWDITTGSTNVIVAVTDTGVRYTHQDLATQMWRNPGEIPGNGLDDDGNGYIDDVFGINAIANNGNPMDLDDHGTHVAGTIGAAANGGGPHVGVSWNVQIMACKFLSGFGGSTADGIECIDYAVEHGARIINASWGGFGYSQALFDALDRARASGVFFVAASGNEGLDTDVFRHYPSGYELDNIISVAATDRDDALADFSNYGLTSVDIGAPGVEIFSCFSGSDTAYSSIDGTSMAAPHVSGVAALILSQFPTADVPELRSRLLLGAVPIPSLTGVTATGRRLNAYNALTIGGDDVLEISVTPPSGSTLLASSSQPIYVSVADTPVSVPTATVAADVPGVGTLTFLNDGVPPDLVANDRIHTATLNVPAATNDLLLTVWATAPGKVEVTNQVTYFVVPPPPNDHFTNAIKAPVAGATYRSNNRFGTKETGEPAHAGLVAAAASLWWAYTPTASTNVFLDTTGSGIDTVLAVYTGNSLFTLVPVGSTNDIGANRQAYLGFSGIGGVTYRIAVASADTNSVGSIQFRLAPGGGPDITPPQIFVSSPVNGAIVTTNLLTVSGTASDPGPNISGVSDVTLSVNGGIPVRASGGTNWSSVVGLQPGVNTIRARAIDAAGNVSSPVTVQVTYFVPGPPNDFFVNAVALSSPSGQATVTTIGATGETGEPNHAGIHGGKSVWWTFTAPADGLLTLTTTGSSFDTTLALYTGNSVSTLTPIAANDDAPSAAGGSSLIAQAVRANQMYRIALDGFDGVSGSAVISNDFSAMPVFHVTVNSTSGGSVTPGSTDMVANGTLTLVATPQAYYLFDTWSGDVVAVTNPLVLTVQGDMTVMARFRLMTFTDGFESGDLTHIAWTSGGDLPWLVRTNVTAAGVFAARSGFIGHGQTSSLIYAGDFQPGDVAFDYKVSSEANFDWLRFYVDGVVRGQWSGEVGWASFAYPLTAGNHTVEWRFVKDVTLADGLDAAFLDNVNLPLVVADTALFRAQLHIQRLPDGTACVDLTGQPGQTYVFQASADMVNWESFSTNTAVGGFARAVDAASVTKSRHYYRALIPVQP